MNLPEVILHTDGGCRKNPGLGAWGYHLQKGQHKKQGKQAYKLTTNNRMELMAVIEGLSALNKPCNVQVYSDSKYVIDGLAKGWAKNWQKKGWIKSDKKPVVNIDLWQRLLKLATTHQLQLHWVKGHSGDTYNEICDQLCNQAMDEAKFLLVDEFYLKPLLPAQA